MKYAFLVVVWALAGGALGFFAAAFVAPLSTFAFTVGGGLFGVFVAFAFMLSDIANARSS